MNKRYFTIGMAGHIDHGKTTLTKALTNVDTDRLKEEKERKISIELGFAPLYEDEHIQISVVDVPGHERFIRQMIAGVAGIDLVVLVVAADEGVMPQTKEHLDILRFLNIRQGIVAITKIDNVDEDLVELAKEDIVDELRGTVFENSPIVLVDSVSKKGVDELKELIIQTLENLSPRDSSGPFRLPIDQVFTVKGQGTVVRGTVYEGQVSEGQVLKVLPSGLEVRARQLQVHHRPATSGYAGQRVAINLTGVAKEDLKRGDVLVSSDHFIVTRTIDVALEVVEDLEYMVKQRMIIKCHIGTAEVMGRIVFFDRNELKDGKTEILCQIRLDEEIVTKRGDRFIIRRPSPQETIGGGWVIDPRGKKHRFGDQTIEELEKKKMGTSKERMVSALKEAKSLSVDELMKRTSLELETLQQELASGDFIQFNGNLYTLAGVVQDVEEEFYDRLRDFHLQNPMKQGLNKRELTEPLLQTHSTELLDYVIEYTLDKQLLKRQGQFISLNDFTPHIPQSWQKRTEQLLGKLKGDGYKVKYMNEYLNETGIPDRIAVDIKKFLEEQGLIVPLNEDFYWHGEVFNGAVAKLKEHTGNEFNVGEAKEILDLSRKYIIPFLERLDKKGFTMRVENNRVWKKKTNE